MKRVHVLFICVGNICRSVMAEAMAHKYGSDVLSAASAGVAPAPCSSSRTQTILAEINVELRNFNPRHIRDMKLDRFDIVVNMSGSPLPVSDEVYVEDWPIEDPYGHPEEEFRKAREKIEMRVMDLILRARLGKLRGPKKTVEAIDSEGSGSRQ